MSESCYAADELGMLLLEVGKGVQRLLLSNRDSEIDSKVVGQQAGDTIYALDRRVEPVISAAVERWPDKYQPILIVAEGFGFDGRLRIGHRDRHLRYQLLIDPIDGTRSLMYDKRSAWFLATIAPDNGEKTRISDSVASVMVELPTSKQLWADEFVFVKNSSVVANRTRTDTGETSELIVRPSSQASLLHGFAQVSSFFPGTKLLAADLMECIAEATLGQNDPGQASIFDDQYISTGGQLVELMLGRDRFCCDLRPIFYDILERRTGKQVSRGLECHPYDMAGMLVAQHAGVILTDGFGRQLDAPFNVSYPIHWCGYANEELRAFIEPVVQNWLHSSLGT